MVKGPSFNRDTFISAPKIPFSTVAMLSLHLAIMYSYSSLARSGLPALINEGRFPFLQSAYSVNCDTNNNSPSTACRSRLVLPWASSKMRSPKSFLIILSAISLVSVSATPISTRNPFPMLPVVSPSTFTSACCTRCITNRICLLLSYVFLFLIFFILLRINLIFDLMILL